MLKVFYLRIVTNFLRHRTLFSLLLFFTSVVSTAQTNPQAQQLLREANKNQYFIENKGQWPSQVKYLAKLNGMNAWITDSGVVYDYFRIDRNFSAESIMNMSPIDKDDFEKAHTSCMGQVVRMDYEGVNLHAEKKGSDKRETYHNYFLGNDSSKWATFVGLYSEVLVKDAFRGIDIRYYFDGGDIRYDYLVNPGADIAQINFRLTGADNLAINETGELTIQTSLGEVRHGKIYAYQQYGNTKKEVECKFERNNNGSIYLSTSNYEKALALVIDPLIYSTYVGGNDIEEGNKIYANPNGEAYVAGSTASQNFPVTSGAYKTTYSGGITDAFVIKLNSSGSAAIFASYIGGNNMDYGLGIAVDTTNNIYLTGRAVSTNFPTTSGVFQPANAGSSDGFVLKLNSLGTALLFSSYIGGVANDFTNDIVIDNSGNSYVEGWTISYNFPTTAGVVQPSLAGNYDAVVCKISPTGSTLLFSTHLGGSGEDLGQGIAIDINRNIYITGTTFSSNFPITSGAFKTSNSGPRDIFVTKLNPSATSILYSTYIGGSSNDETRGIVVDRNYCAYITGTTNSSNFQTTSGCYQSVLKGSSDGYITKLAASGASLIYSSFIGGTNNEYSLSICLQENSNAVISGQTYSSDFPVTTNNVQASLNGPTDAFICKFNITGTNLNFSTYLGGSASDVGFGINTNASGDYFVTGRTYSAGNNFPVTNGAMKTTYGGGSYDGFITKLRGGIAISTGQIKSPMCAGETVLGSYSVSQNFNLGNVFTFQLSNATGSFSSPVTIATTPAITGSGLVNCKIPKNTPYGTGYRIRVIGSNPSVIGSDNGTNLTIYALPKAAYTVNDTTQCLGGNSFAFTNTSTISNGSMSFSWNFGDAGTSALTSPSHSYATPNTFQARLIASSNSGCRDTVIHNMLTYPMPQVGFTINDSTQCLKGNSFTFTNTSKSATSHRWNFGDGGTSVLVSPTHPYTNASTYNVKLVSTSVDGCKDSIIKRVFVYPTPTAGFNINDSTQCLRGNSFGFTNTTSSGGGSVSYLWTFGDGTTSTQANISHVYTSANTFNVKLKVTSQLGCSDSIIKRVYVYASPTASFSINDSTQCLKGNGFSFTNSSASAATYNWNFGDGGTSAATSPTHNYTTANNYSVKLIATSAGGCKDSMSKRTFVYPSPTARFNINDSTQCLRGNNFVFTNTSITGGGSVNFQWIFGDGGTAALFNSSHTYTSSNTFNVKLRVNTQLGCSDSITKPVFVYASPTANFSINDSTQCSKGNSFTFTNASTSATTYNWNFGDGGTSAATSPTHNYTTIANFNVKLVSTTAFGCSDSMVKRTYVYPSPTIGFLISDSTQCLRGNSFGFTNLSSIGSGTLSFLWSFGNGITSTQNSPTYSYSTADTFDVKLRVTSSLGCIDSISKTVYVYPMPIASFTINDSTQCLKANNFIFSNTSTISSGSMGYRWTFGDGGTSTLKDTSRVYAATSTYNLKLVATSGFGCRDSVAKQAFVYADPTANFTVNDSTQCLGGNSFSFTNSSAIASGSMTYLWEFADATSSTATNPSHSFSTNNIFRVKLTATSDKGCADSIRKAEYVYAQPQAKFLNFDSSQCLERNNFGFVNDSKIAAGSMAYLWKFGDGDTSTAVHPDHVYAAQGYYTVTIIATSNFGCVDSFWKRTHIHVHPEPRSQFSVNDTTQCLSGNNFVFTNNTTIASGTFTQRWEFADGDTANVFDTNHIYSIADTFMAKLLVISDWGCKDSILKTIIVYPMPQTGFGINDSSQCFAANSFAFSDSTSISSGTWTNKWTFGDGNSSNTASPTHSYSTAGLYSVKLLARSAFGCADSISKSVYVNPTPVAGFTFQNNNSQCLSVNAFRLNNTSTTSSGTLGSLWNFGDGDTSTLTNPAHSFLSADTFFIKLKVTTSFGCTDSITKQAEVIVVPVADFSINDSQQCFPGNSFIFTNKSVTKGNFYLKWHFGDGDSAAYLIPAHIYKTVDSFPVSLIVRSQRGCVDTIIKTAYVRPMPTASFTINDSAQCLSGNSFRFSNSSTISKGQLFSDWDFDDGNFSNLANPVYPYTADGAFDVRLIISSAYNCSDTAFAKIIVYPNPAVRFSVNDSGQCFKANSFNFINSSSIHSGSLNYNWNLGDGTISSLKNISHTYLSYDTFSVKLLATSLFGCSDSLSKNVYTFAMPQSSFTVNKTSQCLTPNSFVFSNSSSIGAGKFSNNWQFGDGDTSMGNSPVHSYKTTGSFKVELLTISDEGCSDTVSKWIMVNPMPNADFSINDSDQCFKANSFDFTNNSNILSGNLSYSWNLGDASSSTLQDVSHSYAKADTFSIKLVAQSQLGCFDSVMKTVYVRAQPTAAFVIDDSAQCFSGNLFSLKNGSAISDGNLNYIWNFGDGNTSAAKDQLYSYSLADSFEISLLVNSDFNCSDSVKKMVYVDPSPIADFSINLNPQYLPANKFSFTNKSVISAGINNYMWYFGDGSSSFASDPDYSYATADSFEVMLVANSDKGCADTLRKTVYVLNASIIADFTVKNVCEGDTVFFENSSTIINDTFNNFIWDFGDSTGTLNNAKPYHIYKYTGSYLVTMIAISKNGYKDTTSQTIVLLPRPKLDITFVKDTVIYKGQSVTLTANGVFDNVLWSTGELTASIVVDTQGFYSVIATDSNGCKSYGAVHVQVLEKRKFSFMTVFTPNGDGMNDLWKVFDIEQYQPCKLVIYNRWGDELYSTKDYHNNWDGTYKGKTLPEGSYYFVLETLDGKVYKGAVNILK